MQSRTLLLGSLLSLVAVVVGVIWVDGEGTSQPGPLGPESIRQAQPGAAAQGARGSRTLPAVAEASEEQTRTGSNPTDFVLTCRRRDNGQPLAGIRVYQDGAVTAGPSTERGELRISSPAWERRTLWRAGWIPQRVDGSQLPAEVLFDVASAELNITLIRATPHHKVIRSLLQRHGTDTPPSGPWTPELQVESLERLTARDVPSGTYDVYVWVSEDADTPKPYSVQGVELVAGEHTQLSIDLVADAPDMNESDS